MKTKLTRVLHAMICGTLLICNPLLQAQELFDLEAAEEAPNYKQRKLQYLKELYDTGTSLTAAEIKNNQLQRLQTIKQGLGNSRRVISGTLEGKWFERGPNNEAGDLQELDYDPATNDVYALSTVGHIWKGNLDKRKWTVLNDQLSFNTNFLEHTKLPNGGNRLLAIYGAGEDAKKLRYSDDGGKNWEFSDGLDFYDGFGSPVRLYELSDGTLVYIVYTWIREPWGGGFEIFSSKDAGTSFIKILSIQGKGHENYHLSLWKYPKNDQLFLYDTKEQQRYVINAVGNGTPTIIGPENLSGARLPESSFSATGRIIGNQQLHYIHSNTNLYQSTDGKDWSFVGTTTKQDNEALQFWGKKRSFLANPTNDQVYAGGFQFYKTTSNDILKWNEQYGYWWTYYDKNLTNRQDNIHVDITGIKYYEKSDGAPFFVVLNHSGVHISYDNMQTTENLGLDGLNITTLYDHATAPDGTICGGAQDKGTFMNNSDNNSGQTIMQTENQTTGDGMREVFFNNGASFFGFLQNGSLFCKTDKDRIGGTMHWWDVPGQDTAGWINPMEAHPDPAAKKVYIGGGNLNEGAGSYLIEMSVDFDENGNNFSWNPRQFAYDFKANSRNGRSVIKALSPAVSDSNRLYVATTDGTFFYSTNAGTTWIKSNYNIPTSLLPWDIAVSKTDANKVFLCGRGWSNTGVYQSNDGGQQFTPLATDIPSAVFFDIALSDDDKFLFAATSEGPYVYEFETAKWIYMGDAKTPYVSHRSVEYISDQEIVRFGTYGRGIWDFRIANTLSVAEVANEVLQAQLKIFPNPASEQVSIDFDNQLGAKEASIAMFDILGKKVLTTTHTLEVGKTTVHLEVSSLPTGVYTLLFVVDGDKKISKKITLTQ